MKQRTTVSPKRRPTRATSPFAGFRSDHLRVLGHLDLLESDVLDDRAFGSKAAATLRPIVAILGRQFATHMTAEDALLYPWLAETLPESRVSIAELSDDHVELRSLLSGIATAMTQPLARRRNEQIRVQLRDFVDLLRLHIRREETAVFEVADRILRPVEARELLQRLDHFVAVVSPSPTVSGRARTPAAPRSRERKS